MHSERRQLSNLLEEQNVRLRLMDFIMLPTKTLSNSKGSPFVLVKELEKVFLRILVVFLGDHFKHGLWELHVAILKVVIVVSVKASKQPDAGTGWAPGPGKVKGLVDRAQSIEGPYRAE